MYDDKEEPVHCEIYQGLLRLFLPAGKSHKEGFVAFLSPANLPHAEFMTAISLFPLNMQLASYPGSRM